MIIEIAVIITNGNLDRVDEGIEYVIKTDKDVLDRFVHRQGFADCALMAPWRQNRMGEWCTKQHGVSLTDDDKNPSADLVKSCDRNQV